MLSLLEPIDARKNLSGLRRTPTVQKLVVVLAPLGLVPTADAKRWRT